MNLDVNADVGEGAATDAELLQLVTSASVCCAAHAGSPELTRRTLDLAAAAGVRVGAHPGTFDRASFGRRELDLAPRDAGAQLLYQLGGLLSLARVAGVAVRYVKPHGALYHRANRDAELAEAVCAAAYLHGLAVMGLPGSALAAAAARLGLPYLREGFADRRYRPDGTLVPRTDPGAFVADAAEALAQVRALAGRVDTVCVHGDGPQALAFARALRGEPGV